MALGGLKGEGAGFERDLFRELKEDQGGWGASAGLRERRNEDGGFHADERKVGLRTG